MGADVRPERRERRRQANGYMARDNRIWDALPQMHLRHEGEGDAVRDRERLRPLRLYEVPANAPRATAYDTALQRLWRLREAAGRRRWHHSGSGHRGGWLGVPVVVFSMTYIPKMTHEERRERRKQIAEAYSSGRSYSEISAEFNVSIETMRTCRQEFGMPYRAQTSPVTHSPYSIIADIINGQMNMNQIAAKHGVSDQRVRQIQQNLLDAGACLPERKRYQR